jgi:thiosulfate reductase cytochrome b subunit
VNISAKDLKDKILAGNHLPSGLVVNGWLDLEGCTSLTHLPSGLVVNGGLDLEGCTSLTYLPEGLVVHSWLDLKGCISLTHLPSGLVVNGWLDLKECISLTHLPSGLVVHGVLALEGTSLTNFSPCLKAEKIHCDESLIDRIPEEDLPLYINFNFEDSIHEYYTRRLQG